MFLNKNCSLSDCKNDWKRALVELTSKGKLDSSFCHHFLQEFACKKIENPHDYLDLLRELLSFLFLVRLTKNTDEILWASLREKIKDVKKRNWWDGFQLSSMFWVLIDELSYSSNQKIVENQIDKNSSVLIDLGHLTLDGQIPHPLWSVELALIWLYIGLIQEEEKYIRLGLRLAHSLLDFFDSAGIPFQAIWIQERYFTPLSYFSLLYLLFSLCFHFTKTSFMKKLAEIQLRQLRDLIDQEPDHLPFYPLFLSLAFNQELQHKQKNPKIKDSFSLDEENIALGFFRYQNQNFDLLCTASGINTGLGAIHKKAVRILTFGPHFAPLSDTTRFGIYRACTGEKEAFEDLRIDKKANQFQLRGWTHLISPFSRKEDVACFFQVEPTKSWMYFDVEAKKEQAHLTVRFVKLPSDPILFFTFFVVADRVVLQEEGSFTPGSLSRYQGKTQPICLEREDTSLLVTPYISSNMEIIPLAGKKYFWGADFLLAFQMQEDLSFSWSFS